MCYCCNEKRLRLTMIILSALLVIPGIILLILGGLFKKEIKVITNTDAGSSMGSIASGITILFGVMIIVGGANGVSVGCCFTRCPKLARCFSCLYVIKSFLWMVIFFILGIAFLAISTIGSKYVTEYCNGTLNVSSLSANLQQILADVETTSNNFATVPT